jgi:hypothetical protein
MDNQPRKITDLKSLQAEKERLRILAAKQQAVIQEDIVYLKASISPWELLNKLAAKLVPAFLRHSPVINTPINLVAQTLFKKDHKVVDPHSDKGTGNRNRNIALGLAEGIGTWLLTRYVKKRMSRPRDDAD